MAMANINLSNAKRARNDEFYTRYADIEAEINAYLDADPHVFRNKTVLLPCDDPEWSSFTKYFAQNFERLGLTKLISTSYAPTAAANHREPSATESNSPLFDPAKTTVNGKIFTLCRDRTGDHRIDVNDLEWDYLEGDGDFRSDEVTRLRDEADIIVTNPPFSLFREFLAWIVEADKKFVIIGNKNGITCKEVFPLFMDDRMWVGVTSFSKDMLFIPPKPVDPLEKPASATRVVNGVVYLRSPSVWLTNLDHKRRHQPLSLMTMEENLRFPPKGVKGWPNYARRYDNYDAIEVPATLAIPIDCTGVMGVPISFLDKYAPEQFEIIGLDRYVSDNPKPGHRFRISGRETYVRILIKKRPVL
jgi:Adenine-specific methyltransferase EcoRI